MFAKPNNIDKAIIDPMIILLCFLMKKHNNKIKHSFRIIGKPYPAPLLLIAEK